MPEIVEYDYYDAVLSVTIATTLPTVEASTILAAASLHEEYAARLRVLLREFRKPLDAYLSFYSVDKIRPASSARDVEPKANQSLMRQQFQLGFTLTSAAWIGEEVEVFAFERNIETAVRDLLEANGLHHVIIPGDGTVRGESYIDISVTLVGATNQGVWNVAG